MTRLRLLTAGESHGRGLVGIIEGIPANLSISADYINQQLVRRQKGYGRGGRMKIESDRVEIISGVRWGRTLGSPVALYIENRDWQNWQKGMSVSEEDAQSIEPVVRPRPGHADLAGIIKYAQQDIRNVLERSSARETAMRVALGAVVRRMLDEFGISIGSFVTSVGGEVFQVDTSVLKPKDLLALYSQAEGSEVRCPSADVTSKMKEEIDRAKEGGYSLGGRFVVFATGVPPGLGSHIQWDRRLDGRVAQALMSIQAIKAVSIGEGFEMATSRGSEVMDEMVVEGSFSLKNIKRKTNHAGGIEGGITNGMPVVVKASMKPIPTQRKPLRSVDLATGSYVEAAYERSDICAVAAASVVAEAMLALVIGDALLEKFGGDSIEETKRNLESFLKSL
jgi:chorismate synthase